LRAGLAKTYSQVLVFLPFPKERGTFSGLKNILVERSGNPLLLGRLANFIGFSEVVLKERLLGGHGICL
jgi:hypothetical protein